MTDPTSAAPPRRASAARASTNDAAPLVRARAAARVGLLGNPSDGYRGACIAVAIANFGATATLRSAVGVSIRCGDAPARSWSSLEQALACDPRAPDADPGADEPLDSGVRLALAGIRRLASSDAARLAQAESHRLTSASEVRRHPAADGGRERGAQSDPARPGFALELATDIPREVGFSGSSALVIAAMRALAAHWKIAVAPDALAALALAAEVDDLGIAAGPMDRLIQAHGGALFMDFAPAVEAGPNERAGIHRRIPLEQLPPLWLAWDPRGGESSGILHGGLRARWLRGEPEVLAAIARLRALALAGETALQTRNQEQFRGLMDRNFDERASLLELPARDHELVRIARESGASARLCGSGGAVVVAAPPDLDIDALTGGYREAGYAWARLVASPPTSPDPPGESANGTVPTQRRGASE